MYKPELAYYSYNDNTIIYPEDKIDLFDVLGDDYQYPTDGLIMYDFKPYTELSIMTMDIETTGLDPKIDKIYMIGLMRNNGKKLVLSNKNEKQLLIDFCSVLMKVKPDVISNHNIFEFDLPFLEYRFNSNNLDFPFLKSENPKKFNTALRFGKPIEFYPYRVKSFDCCIFDTYQQLLAWDNVKRKLHNYNLKDSVVTLGLRKESRLNISYSDMMKYYQDWNLTEMIKYLEYDLEDAMLLTNKLLPPIYKQKRFLNWNLQSISYSGNGSKWNSILRETIKPIVPPESDPKLNFQGAFTFAKHGLYGNSSKNLRVYQIDFTSLYPNTMLRNMAYSHEKDPNFYLLRYLQIMTNERIRLKKLGKQGDLEAEYEQEALKRYINSGYGMAGTGYIEYNDMKVAAFVTSYGRKLTKHVVGLLNSLGAEVVQVDTDGLIYVADGNIGVEIFNQVNKAMPSGFKLELEYNVDAVYIPIQTKGVNKGKAKRKNYLMFKDGKIVKQRGTINKRELSKLEREFTMTYLTKLIYEKRSDVFKYYIETINRIKQGKLEISDIIQSKTARSNEKEVFESGLVKDGKATFYYGDKMTQLKTKQRLDFVKVNQGDYSIGYYTKLIDSIVKNISV